MSYIEPKNTMSEAEYERMVAALEQRYAKTIAAEAASAIIECGDEDEATDRVASELLNDSAWEHVHATDISDIAYEACENARREAGD